MRQRPGLCLPCFQFTSLPAQKDIFSCKPGENKAKLTLFLQACRELLPLLKMGPWQHLQNLLNAAPARPGQQLGQAHTQRGIAAVHVRDVIGVLRDTGGRTGQCYLMLQNSLKEISNIK